MGTTSDAPITNFSQCHVGILSHLKAFGGLPALLEPAEQARRLGTIARAQVDPTSGLWQVQGQGATHGVGSQSVGFTQPVFNFSPLR